MNSDLPQEVLQLTNPQNPKTPISFWYQKEKCIELNLDNEDGKNNSNNTNHHWPERVIDEGQTKLTDYELLEFLQLAKTATFAFFKIKRKGDSHCYFMAIRNVLLGHLLSISVYPFPFRKLKPVLYLCVTIRW